MNRLTTAFLIVIAILGIGAAVTSLNAQSNSTETISQDIPNLNGKSVIIERDGWYIGVKEDVRFASVGQRDFLVVPMNHKDGESYNYWIGLEKISGLKVFEKLEDAISHDKKTSPHATKN
jgi:hypothetical protein